MATQSSRKAARAMLSPTVILLLVWMIVPLAMTLWFSLQRYNLLYPDRTGFNDFGNYTRFVLSPAFGGAVVNTLILVVGVLAITVILGILIALLIFGVAASRVYELTIPTLLSATWPVDSHAVSGLTPPATSVWGKSMDYNPRTRTVTVLPAGLAYSGPDTVMVYRPRGT